MKNAVALAYLAGSAAPKVVATGSGLIAEAIIERAREHGVFVHESKELVSLLMQVDLDQQIPPALYRAVAELLAWLYRLENRQDLGLRGSKPLERPDLAPGRIDETVEDLVDLRTEIRT